MNFPKPEGHSAERLGKALQPRSTVPRAGLARFGELTEEAPVFFFWCFFLKRRFFFGGEGCFFNVFLIFYVVFDFLIFLGSDTTLIGIHGRFVWFL